MTITSAARLELRLLGELHAAIDGSPLCGKLYDKVLGLLAYLAVESDRAHSRERLADFFWPEIAPESARTNLRQALYHLRRALNGERFLQIQRDRIRLAPDAPFWLDLHEFRKPLPECDQCRSLKAPERCLSCLHLLENRSTLYRGAFLQNLDIEDAPEFQEWRSSWQEILFREALAIHETLRTAYERRGDLSKALDHAHRTVALDPWNEEGHRQLMRLLAMSGQRAAALAHYAHCRAMLARELDAEPEEATEALARAIEENKLAPATTIQRKRERRPATVMALLIEPTDRRDPEIVAEQLREPRRRAMLLAERAGAYVVQTPDGGLIGYFGYPAALEDAGRRAVRAAVDIVADAPPSFALRIGIHTGVIVMHDDTMYPDASGQAPAAALRLAALALPGQVVVDEPTRKLIYREFALQPEPKFGTYTVCASEIARNTPPPLTGRQTELDWLRAQWERVRSGTPGIVLIRGEAGLGKSRLAHALRDLVTDTGGTAWKMHCYAQYQATPLRPIIALLEDAYGLQTDDSPEIRLHKLTDGLALRYPDQLGAGTDALGPLLAPKDDEPITLSPSDKQRLFALLLELLDELARRQPVLMILEDLHWADPSTLELLELYGRQRSRSPVLLVLTARPQLRLAWLEESAVLDLSPLDDAAMRGLLKVIAPELGPDAVTDIIARAEGIPLFAEELARAAIDPEARGFPLSLSYLIQARLDALGEAGRVAQLAAVLGRAFDRELLERIGAFEPATLDDMLARLEVARLIVPARGGYEFRHALIHEAVRASLLHSDARRTHALVAHKLVAELPWRAAHHPEQVAYHFTAAGAVDEAVHWWLEAGKRALAVPALAEASAHLRNGLALLARLPPNQANANRELELLLALGQTLLAHEGYGSPEAATVFERAFSLLRHQQPCVERFQALAGLWLVSSSQKGYAESQRLADALLEEAEALGSLELRAVAHAAATNIAMWRGQLARCCEHAKQAIELSQAANRPWIGINGYEALISSLAHLSWARHAQGREDDALEASARTIEAARAGDDPYTLCLALLFAAMLRRFRGEVARATDLASEVHALAQRHRLPLWEGAAGLVLGWAAACRGDAAGVERLRAAVATLRLAMPSALVAGLHALADALGAAGDFAAQLETVDSALAAAAALDEHFHEADLQRMRGTALLQLGRREEARAAFATARRLAQAQGASGVLSRIPAD